MYAQALAGGPLIQARNFAVMTGVNAGLSCVLRRLKGKEDVQTRYVHRIIAGDSINGYRLIVAIKIEFLSLFIFFFI